MTSRGPKQAPTEVQLRDVTTDDLPIFFAHQQDPAATRMADFPARDRDAHMAHWAKIMADDTVTTQTILVDGQVAGNVVCFAQDGEREVGYWIGRDYWGQGVATKALAAFLRLVSTRPLYAHVAKHNVASLRVLEKCGFTIAGEHAGFANTDGEAVEEIVLELRA